MTDTGVDVFVFDLDDKLVQSAGVKRQAFFKIFQPGCEPAVASVLSHDPDSTRHAVIPAMLAAASGIDTSGITAEGLIEAYAARVPAGVRDAGEVPEAAGAFRWASENTCAYIISMTPHEELLAHIERRGWGQWIRQAFGYPNRKPSVLATLLGWNRCPPDRVLVVGDGVSDAEAAQVTGCHYLDGVQNWPAELARMAGRDD